VAGGEPARGRKQVEDDFHRFAFRQHIGANMRTIGQPCIASATA
jgi:hypothetical protein